MTQIGIAGFGTIGRVVARHIEASELGLSLAAAVARFHHGALRIEDNEPGLRVVLAIPASSPAIGARMKTEAKTTQA